MLYPERPTSVGGGETRTGLTRLHRTRQTCYLTWYATDLEIVRVSCRPQRVVACVVSRGELLLLAQRPPHKRHGGLWEFPGGKAEANESDESAAARELQEELGVQLVQASPPIFEIADEGSPYVIAFVPVEIQGEPVTTEHSRIIWGLPIELAKLALAPSDEAFLQWILTRQSSTGHG